MFFHFYTPNTHGNHQPGAIRWFPCVCIFIERESARFERGAASSDAKTAKNSCFGPAARPVGQQSRSKRHAASHQVSSRHAQ